MVEGFEYLIMIAPADLDELLTYFDNMYVNGIYRAISFRVSHLMHGTFMNKHKLMNLAHIILEFMFHIYGG